MKRILCLLAVLLILLPLPVLAEDSAPDYVRQSVVHLYAIGKKAGTTTRWTGTGFAVGIEGQESDVFLTNRHVALGSRDYDSVRLWILRDGARFDGRNVPLPVSAIECEVLATSEDFPDVAVIRAKEPTGCRALSMLSSRRVTDGTKVYAFGFPGLAATNYGANSAPESMDVTEGTITEHLAMTSAGNTRSLIHTAPIRHGNSGGPLVNSDGVVVGQNTYGFEEDVTTELFCSVYIDYGMEMLDSLSIPYTSADGPHPIQVWIANLIHVPTLSAPAAWLLFAAGICLCAAFVWYFLKTVAEAWQELKQKFRKSEETS